MPLMRCQADGKDGWKWGSSGKCYTGPEGKGKAKKQGRAIEREKHMNGQLSEESPADLADLYVDEAEEAPPADVLKEVPDNTTV